MYANGLKLLKNIKKTDVRNSLEKQKKALSRLNWRNRLNFDGKALDMIFRPANGRLPGNLVCFSWQCIRMAEWGGIGRKAGYARELAVFLQI